MTSQREGRERAERHRQNGAAAHQAASGATASPSAEIESLALEAALEELDRIVATLEDGRLSLDDSLALYERGMRLTQHCQQMLDTAALRVQRLRPAQRATASGGAGYDLEDFEADDEE
jgi:exodeoxyribonuclease VII small subunit